MFQNVTAIKIKELRNLAPVFRKVDSTIHWINHYPLDSAWIGFCNTYHLDSEFIPWIALYSFWTTGARTLNTYKPKPARLTAEILAKPPYTPDTPLEWGCFQIPSKQEFCRTLAKVWFFNPRRNLRKSMPCKIFKHGRSFSRILLCHRFIFSLLDRYIWATTIV